MTLKQNDSQLIDTQHNNY